MAKTETVCLRLGSVRRQQPNYINIECLCKKAVGLHVTCTMHVLHIDQTELCILGVFRDNIHL